MQPLPSALRTVCCSRGMGGPMTELGRQLVQVGSAQRHGAQSCNTLGQTQQQARTWSPLHQSLIRNPVAWQALVTDGVPCLLELASSSLEILHSKP